MATPRKLKDERDARACLAAAKAAGMSNAEWAREWGVDGRSLNAWRINLSRGRSASSPRRRSTRSARRAQLVELVPISAAKKASRYIVHVGAVSIEVGDDFDDATLRRLIAVLRSC